MEWFKVVTDALIRLVQILAWPSVVIFALTMFRRSLSSIFARLADRLKEIDLHNKRIGFTETIDDMRPIQTRNSE